MLINNRLRLFQKKGFEKFITKLLFTFIDLDAYLRNGCQHKTILVTPSYPSKKTTIYKISRNLKIPIVNLPSPSNVLSMVFSDQTFLESNEKSGIFTINENCLDISKKKVDSIHQKIFNYNTQIDPITFKGKGVIKSDTNAVHDGTIIQFPITKKDSNKIYQIVIDNEENNLYLDYRVCVVNKEIPIIYQKYKTLEKRFTNDVLYAKIGALDCIPQNIKDKIIKFTQEMQCEFCELDVLKDNQTGNWFIIDLNKTPYGPPAVLSKKDKKKAVQILSNSFYNNFIK
jgi:hypothetical protein